MQKISSYLYPNRVNLLIDLAGFNVEYTNVYQRTVKIYSGIDNVIEFDIKNADQKRIETRPDETPVITDIQLNVMDASGNALPNSPYLIDADTGIKGIVKVTIPQEDLNDLTDQYLTYSVVASKDGNDVILYGDSQFGALGKMQLVGSAMPTFRDDKVYDTFQAEIDLKGTPTYHSSAIPAKFYEAVPTETMDLSVKLTGFTGSVWIEGTKKTTINLEAFKGADFIHSYTFDDFSGFWNKTVSTANYQYFRVSYSTPLANGIGSSYLVTLDNGSYDVTVKSGGTGYAVGSRIKVLGSLLGGVDGINDLILTVTQVDNASHVTPSSYSQSTVTQVSWTGTAVAGSQTYVVTGTNLTGSVDNVVVSS